MRLDPREQLEQDDARRVDVGAGVGTGPGDLLGGQIRHGADDHARSCLAADGQCPGETEVNHLQVAVRRDQHVLRLDVPVHDPGGVRGRQARQQRHHDGQRLTGRAPAALAEQVAQSAAGQVLHGQIGARAVPALVVDGDHVRVREPRGRLGLADEPADEILVAGQVGVHHLERDPAVQAGVDGTVHRRHAPECNQRLHLVAAVKQPPDQGVREGGVHRGNCTSRSAALGWITRFAARRSPEVMRRWRSAGAGRAQPAGPSARR